jgi:hypothetical protein
VWSPLLSRVSNEVWWDPPRYATSRQPRAMARRTAALLVASLASLVAVHIHVAGAKTAEGPALFGPIQKEAPDEYGAGSGDLGKHRLRPTLEVCKRLLRETASGETLAQRGSPPPPLRGTGPWIAVRTICMYHTIG